MKYLILPLICLLGCADVETVTETPVYETPTETQVPVQLEDMYLKGCAYSGGMTVVLEYAGNAEDLQEICVTIDQNSKANAQPVCFYSQTDVMEVDLKFYQYNYSEPQLVYVRAFSNVYGQIGIEKFLVE